MPDHMAKACPTLELIASDANSRESVVIFGGRAARLDSPSHILSSDSLYSAALAPGAATVRLIGRLII